MARRTPKYCRQKRTGLPDRAYVALNGQRHYLGVYGTKSSRERYDRLLAQWHANHGQLPSTGSDLSIVSLLAAFLRHAKTYYVGPDGRATSTMFTVKSVMRRMRKLYGSTLATEFGPNALRIVRQTWVDEGKARVTVNDYTNLLKQIFKWGVSHEMVPPSCYEGLRAVEGLRKNRSTAKETDPVRPVPEDDILAIKPYVSRQIWALIQIGLYTGARPGEYVALRAIDLDISGDVWTYRPQHHKTAHHGQDRTIYFGPRAQEAIRPFMANRPIDTCLFSPREAARELKQATASGSRRPGQPYTKITDRVIGDHYTTDSYRRAVSTACKNVGVPVWTPNQLRHNAATRLRENYGIDVAGTVLGHSIASAVTAIYAESSATRAELAIASVG